MEFECPRCKEMAQGQNETTDKQGVHFQCPKCRAEFVVSYDVLNDARSVSAVTDKTPPKGKASG